MLVYRLELNGIGPYHNRYEDDVLRDMAIKHGSREWPSWMEDFDNKQWGEMLEYGGDYLSGCESLKALKNWFRGYWRKLTKRGFKLHIYNVPDECVFRENSGKQVVFQKYEAQLVTA